MFGLPASETSAQLYNTYNFKPLVCFTLSEYSNVITQMADTEENIIPKVAAVSLVGVISFAAAGSKLTNTCKTYRLTTVFCIRFKDETNPFATRRIHSNGCGVFLNDNKSSFSQTRRASLPSTKRATDTEVDELVTYSRWSDTQTDRQPACCSMIHTIVHLDTFLPFLQVTRFLTSTERA